MRTSSIRNVPGVSMRLRLLGFLAVLVFTLLVFVFIILLLTGTFTAGHRETEHFYESELASVAARVEKDFGDISVSAVGLSMALSESIERSLSNMGVTAADLSGSPELLESVLDSEFERLLFSMEKTGASGVFVVLDATVNEQADGAEFSRTGLYLKNMEPNVVSASSPTVTVLRGFPDIARNRGYSLHAQWEMEFATDHPPDFFLPLHKSKGAAKPLSRLYYWSPAATMPSTSENAMICTVPLIDSRGNAFGVCGYEVSAMLFKLKYMPDNSTYRRAFCMLAPIDGSSLKAGSALFAGSCHCFYVTEDTTLTVKKGNDRLFSYQQEGGISLTGLHKDIKLYPDDSVFSDRFALGILMPQKDLDALLFPLTRRLILLCAMFLLLGIAASALISKRYMAPIAAGLSAINLQDVDSIGKTNITEIDEIIEQIKSIRKDRSLPPDNLFEDFITRIRMLTPTEKTIFRYYAEGKTNNEILSLMYISLSTLKTHNSHIYGKLGINSKEELLLYVKLIQKTGRFAEIES